ncbi:hypothetical protein [Pedobacter sp. BMA]|uniref:hypothetical protein n=1 Tax=Pedobacter sp. BMA TaxID=1663685 RepID=UPI00064A37AB|nr:hypothetical protein [Pedobacter sp. BMA]KLT63712.1 hypothetical protein AB669_20920 [Pedobacter sp. BMA]
MLDDSKVRVKSPFNDQYTIIIESEVNGVDVHIHSKVQLRYDFSVLQASTDQLEVRLIQLDNVVLEANSPLVTEVAQVSQIFGRMYSELHLLLSAGGEVLEVLNIGLLLSKWKQTKAEMEKYILGNDALKDAIILNDEIFNNPEKIKIAVQANEFLRLYFGQVFNRDTLMKATVKGTNIFNTTSLDWTVETRITPVASGSGDGLVQVDTIVLPANAINKDFIKSAYGQFEGKIELSNLKPELSQHEQRVIDPVTGRLQEARVSKTEVADEARLYNKLTYTLNSDRRVNANDVPQPVSTETESSKSKFSFF